jgi:hypothetical protein
VRSIESGDKQTLAPRMAVNQFMQTHGSPAMGQRFTSQGIANWWRDQSATETFILMNPAYGQDYRTIQTTLQTLMLSDSSQTKPELIGTAAELHGCDAETRNLIVRNFRDVTDFSAANIRTLLINSGVDAQLAGQIAQEAELGIQLRTTFATVSRSFIGREDRSKYIYTVTSNLARARFCRALRSRHADPAHAGRRGHDAGLVQQLLLAAGRAARGGPERDAAAAERTEHAVHDEDQRHSVHRGAGLRQGEHVSYGERGQ